MSACQSLRNVDVSTPADRGVAQRALAAAETAGSAEEKLERVCAELRAALAEPATARLPVLNERQMRTLRLLSQGLSNRGIARRLGLAEETVKCHVRSLLDRLNVPNRTSLALWAIREGVVPLHDAEAAPRGPMLRDATPLRPNA